MVTGIVNQIRQSKAWSAQVDGEWYGCGFEKPSFNEGDMISFEISMRGQYKNINIDTLKVLEQSSAEKTSNTKSKPPAKGNDYDDRQNSISWQSARNDSIDFLKLLVETEALSLGTKGKRIPILEETLLTYTNKFYNESKTQEEYIPESPEPTEVSNSNNNNEME